MKRPKIKIHRTVKELGASYVTPRYYFTVVAANGETLATSEIFTRKADAKRSANALRRAILLATIQDNA